MMDLQMRTELGEPPQKRSRKIDGQDEETPQNSVENKDDISNHGMDMHKSSASKSVDEIAKPLKEKDVGMEEFLSSNEGFTAVIKQRYSDFLVNEVDIEGRRVVLNDLEAPACDDMPEAEDCNKGPDLLSIFSEEKLIDITTVNSTREGQVLIPASEDKAQRTAMHQVIREHFTNVESAYTEKDGIKYISVLPSKSKKQKKQRGWPKNKPDYCKFVLYKENVDTIEAVNLLAKYLRINAGAFNYAGTKDKRAKTSQHVTCHRMEAGRLHKLNRILRGVAVGDFSYCSAPLKLGDLSGNHFTIILRNVTGTHEQIKANMEVINDIGFINYFGMQRFGTTSVPTHHVGRAILHNKWEEVVDLILKAREGDNAQLAEVRRIWQATRNAGEALQRLGKKTCVERHLLVGLTKHGSDLVAAIHCIPKNLRLMYVHSYQAFIWNRVVSERLRTGGLSLTPGDLVISSAQRLQNKKASPTVITESNIGEFMIHDLVLPTPGYDVTYPKGALRDKYSQLLAHDGFHFDSFRHKIKDYSLSGMYRVVIHKATELNYEILSYSDYTKPLALSDLDKLRSVVLAEDNGKDRTALKLEFTLPPSTYATMLIREVLKCDTSAAFQTTLNT